jgi:hypothetical protein
MNGFYVDSYGVKCEFGPNFNFYLSGKNLVEFIIPDGSRVIHCNNNNLTKLDLPDSVEYISCKGNNLTELIVPDNCGVDCDPDVRIITRTMYNRSNRLKNLLK